MRPWRRSFFQVFLPSVILLSLIFGIGQKRGGDINNARDVVSGKLVDEGQEVEDAILKIKEEFVDLPRLSPIVRTTTSYVGEGSDDLDAESSALFPNYDPDKVFTVREAYDPVWVDAQPHLCADREDPFLLIFVISAPSNLANRMAIRAGWGNKMRLKNSTADFALAFLVGRTMSSDQQELLTKEAEEFGDLLINGNVDTYWNMTLKTIAALEWTRTYCTNVNWILKADDDVFVQMSRLLELLERSPHSSPVILGQLAKNWAPGRVLGHKYYVSPTRFDQTFYPPFVTGPSYLISRSAVEGLLQETFDRVYVHLEDVFVTGIVAEAAGIPRRMLPTLKNNGLPIQDRFIDCTLLKTISIHKVEPDQQLDMIRKAENPQCGLPK